MLKKLAVVAALAVSACSVQACDGAPKPGDLGTRDNPIPIGTSADIGVGWTVTVNSVNLDATQEVADASRVNVTAPIGTTYVVANVTLEFNGDPEKSDVVDESSSVSSVSLSAVGTGTNVETGREFSTALTSELKQFGEVFKGGKVTGNVVFAVPNEDLKDLVIIGDVRSPQADPTRKFFAVS